MKNKSIGVFLFLTTTYVLLFTFQIFLFFTHSPTGKVITGGELSFCVNGVRPEFTLPLGCPSQVEVGKIFFCDVEATDAFGDNITFSDNSTDFEIENETGIILFIPEVERKHSINITISDESGCENSQNSVILDFNVIPPSVAAAEEFPPEIARSGGIAAQQAMNAMATVITPLAINIPAPVAGSASASASAVMFKNNLPVAMSNIHFTVKGNPVIPFIFPDYISLLPPSALYKLLLNVSISGNGSHSGAEHKVTLFIESEKPHIKLKRIIPIKVIEGTLKGKEIPSSQPTASLSQLMDAYTVSQQLKCPAIIPFLHQAQVAIAKEQFDIAESLAQHAIDVCSFFAGALQEPEKAYPFPFFRFDINSIILALLIIGMLVYLFFQKKPPQNDFITVNVKRSSSLKNQ